MSEEHEEPAPAQAEGDDEDVITPGYKAPQQVSLKTLQELDADDESLVKYKQALLGGAENVLGIASRPQFVHVCIVCCSISSYLRGKMTCAQPYCMGVGCGLEKWSYLPENVEECHFKNPV